MNRPSRCTQQSDSVYVWRTPKETYIPEWLVPTVKHGSGTVAIWVAVTW